MGRVSVDQAYYALAQHLHDAGVAQYKKVGKYTDDPTRLAVYLGPLPATPVHVLGVWRYDTSLARDAFNPDLYFQLRFRAAGSILAVERLSDKVFGELDWTGTPDREEVWPGGVRVQHSVRVVRTPASPGPNDQYELTDSYKITFNTKEEE